MFAEGLKLMVLGMTSVMLFLILMILFIELVKHFNRNFTTIEKTSIDKKEESEFHFSKTKKNLPIELFAAAISAFESDRKSNSKNFRTKHLGKN